MSLGPGTVVGDQLPAVDHAVLKLPVQVIPWAFPKEAPAKKATANTPQRRA